jgi:hypothetical protein
MTYSISFTDSTWDRTVRTTGASIPMTIAMTTLFRDEPSTAMMASTMIRPGTACIASTIRCTTRSTERPAYAEARPTANHPVTPIRTAPSPTYSEMRAPYMIRLMTSRPTWSVPIG